MCANLKQKGDMLKFERLKQAQLKKLGKLFKTIEKRNDKIN